MIKFKNVAGNNFLAVGTIQRKFALNGEKSLSGVLYDGDDVLNNIDKGWSLEFDGEPYVVSYFERNDNDNTLSFDAVHKFFWVMSKSVMYSQTSGSHTIQWYLDQIFANTGYTYALNFSPNAIAKDNWGMKTKLSLFNDIISSINGEFEINGTLISVFEKVGSDLSTIVRYGFNLSDMSIENDAAGFVTYGEGFGAYEDQQNQSGPRLHATYTSPLASVYGILQAEPVDDQRYTIENNLVQAIKEKVDNSFTVSIKLSLYDLTAAGYPYKMAHVGDWLMAIDEKLDFKQRIRIISIDDEFDANSNRISYTVTAGNIGVVQKYQEANASLSSQVSNALDTANKASDDANIALISANGKNTSYYVDSVDALPTTANEGDMGWVQSGDGRVLYIYTKKPDGTYYWEKRIDPEMGEQIAAGVDKAVTDAKTYSDQAIATNREQVDAEIKTVSDKTAQLESEQAELDTKAQGYADKALADAKADTQATAAQTAKDASDALAKAKTDLTTSLNKEVTDRANAVTALDTKAQGYATQAKTDAISASATADGVINKKIDDTASSITSTISQNKTDADGKITTAQTTAQQALDGLSTKVSLTDYNAKTGQLQTDLNTTTTTANQAKTDIVSIKSKNDSQDARMTTIESDVNGTKTTVSNLQTDLGKVNGSITTLQQRADGFDATVTKVNNLAVGGRNLLTNTNKDISITSHTTDTWPGWAHTDTGFSFENGKTYTFSAEANNSTDKITEASIRVFEESTNTQVGIYAFPADGKRHSVTFTIPNDSHNYHLLFYAGHAGIIPGVDVTTTYHHQKLEAGNIATDWSPAPEDVDSTIAKAQLTADQAITSLNNYKSDADGRISKAQADIIVNANAITTKVSQSDYNAKTGDLATKINTAQSTADSATSTIGSYKTSNDERVASAESKITANANAITQKVSQSDYNQKTGELSGEISSVKQAAGEINQTVANVQVQVNGLSVGGRNVYLNSKTLPDGLGVNGNSNVTVTTEWADSEHTTKMWHIVSPQNNGTGVGIYLWGYADNKIATNSYWSYSADIKGTGRVVNFGIELGQRNPVVGNVTSDWSRISQTGYANSNPKHLVMYFDTTNTPLDVYIKLPKLELGNMPTDWTPAPEDTAAQISTVSQKVDSITSIVSDPTTGLSKRVQTAEGTLSQVSGVDIPNLQKSTFLQPYGSLDLNSYTKQGSFFFNTTDPRTNAPTDAQNWMYLVVEQGAFDRVTQTVWYDTKDAAKITYKRQYDGTWGSWYANDNDSVTSISQTNGAIQQEVNNRVTGDSNTLTQAKDFTSSSISNSETGMKSLITQTADGIQAQVDTKTDHDTVLSILKENWSIGISDNTGALASGVFGDINGMTLNGNTVTINANQTVITGTAFITDAMLTTMSASKLTAGTIDANQINVTNINANNIVSGAISGDNLNINLNTGQVVFQKGRIYDLSGKLDINIDQSYISTASNDTRATLRQGELILTDPSIFDSSTTPYLSIQNMVSGSSLAAAAFIARDYATVTNSANQGNIYTVPLGTETFSGLSTGRASSGKWQPTKVAGAERGVVIAGGASTDGGASGAFMSSSPYITVGMTTGNNNNGDRVVIWSSYTHLISSYQRTTSNGANVFIAGDGAVVRSSSSSKYKLDIEYEQQAETANRLLTLDPATWHDKFESEQLDKFHKIGVDPERAIDMSNPRYYGIIAEDLVKAGLEHLVSRNVETGEVEGVEYSKVGVALIPIIRDLRNRLNDQYVEIERLKEQLK